MLTGASDTSTIMHISRPEALWENYQALYGRVDFIENTSSTLPGLAELEGDPVYREYWNGLYMDQQNIPLEHSTVITNDTPEEDFISYPSVYAQQATKGNYGYVSHGYNKEISLRGAAAAQAKAKASRNIHRAESHYYSKHKNPYIIQPTSTKTSLITTIKNKVIKWGKELDKGTEEYIKKQKRWNHEVEEQNRKIRSQVKAYEKLHGKSAMDKIARAETISHFKDVFQKKGKIRVRKTIY